MAGTRRRTSNGSHVSEAAESTTSTAAPSNGHTDVDSAAASSSSDSVRDPFSYHAVELAATDALPYFDRDLELQPGLRAKVDALIAEEQSTMSPIDAASSSRLPPAYVPFSTRPDLRAELDRIGSGEPSAHTLDTHRYTLPSPEAGEDASVEDWQKALDNAHAQLGHMDVRLKNIELLKRYGSNAWRLANFQQEHSIRLLNEQADAVKAETNETNRLRQKDHTEAGKRLTSLDSTWTELISRGLQLEVANITTRSEIHALQTKKRKLEAQLAQLD